MNKTDKLIYEFNKVFENDERMSITDIGNKLSSLRPITQPQLFAWVFRLMGYSLIKLVEGAHRKGLYSKDKKLIIRTLGVKEILEKDTSVHQLLMEDMETPEFGLEYLKHKLDLSRHKTSNIIKRLLARGWIKRTDGGKNGVLTYRPVLYREKEVKTIPNPKREAYAKIVNALYSRHKRGFFLKTDLYTSPYGRNIPSTGEFLDTCITLGWMERNKPEGELYRVAINPTSDDAARFTDAQMDDMDLIAKQGLPDDTFALQEYDRAVLERFPVSIVPEELLMEMDVQKVISFIIRCTARGWIKRGRVLDNCYFRTDDFIDGKCFALESPELSKPELSKPKEWIPDRKLIIYNICDLPTSLGHVKSLIAYCREDTKKRRLLDYKKAYTSLLYGTFIDCEIIVIHPNENGVIDKTEEVIEGEMFNAEQSLAIKFNVSMDNSFFVITKDVNAAFLAVPREMKILKGVKPIMTVAIKRTKH